MEHTLYLMLNDLHRKADIQDKKIDALQKTLDTLINILTEDRPHTEETEEQPDMQRVIPKRTEE